MKKLFQIRVDSSSQIEQDLALKIGEKHCCFAIIDRGGKKLSQAAYYSVEKANDNSLINLFVNHPELNNDFRKIIVCYDFSQAVLVPQSYISEEASNILRSAYNLNAHSIVATQSVPDHKLEIIYAVPKEINEWIKKKFYAANFFHHYSIPIQGNYPDEHFLIDFRTDEFSLIAAKENKLLLAQTFSYSNPDDVIYYLLKTAEQFSLSPKNVKSLLSGLIEKDSALFKELYQYFLNFEFRNADWEVENNEYPAHFFTSLNDLIKCAS